ncbi:U-box domain-containing protein 4-like isoform X2 [Telopea speciosissima]|uniref:U-box domain-containing protein 4-like isoform X2 n=1 Tax=Telopea speciosissima TaxID=54955 RepID=UPI001CC36B39|nr:U-box domain-containing protein 4-like isoform X2 [Telopea speciosissima]
MVSVAGDSRSNELPSAKQIHYSSTTISSPTSSKVQRTPGRSMRTIRSNLFENDRSCSFPTAAAAADDRNSASASVSEYLSESVIDFRLRELAVESDRPLKPSVPDSDLLDLSQAFSDFSACSSDISGELQRLACLPSPDHVYNPDDAVDLEPESNRESLLEPRSGFLQRENLSSEILDNAPPENLETAVEICVEGLQSSSISVQSSAAAKLRLLAKNRSENRALIGESGAIPALIPLLGCSDPWAQEHAVTALLNLSLHEDNKTLITDAGAIKPLIYVLKTGTEVSKQNAACALLSLALIDDNKISIGACGAIPPLVSLLLNGSTRGKKDALTTLYKLCTVRQNKERAVIAGVVKPLVVMVSMQGSGLAEKAMVVLSSLAAIPEGRSAIVEEGGIPVLVEAIEDGSAKGKEFSVLTLLQLCADNVRNRGLLVREGGIPPLVAFSQSGTARAKHKAETLLRYLREPRQEASSSSPMERRSF